MTNTMTSILVGQMHERVDEKGHSCVVGDFGLARIVLVRSDKTVGDGSILWDMYIEARLKEMTQPDKSGWHAPATPEYPIGSLVAEVP